MSKARIGIVGLGLIGGSLAYDLAAAGHHIVGFHHKEGPLRAAKEAGVIQEGYLGLTERMPLDLLILAVPVGHLETYLEKAHVLYGSDVLVTDVGSVKASILTKAKALGARFIGGHPMAGRESSGFANAQQGLFRGANYFLVPAEHIASEDYGFLEQIVRQLQANPIRIGPEKHDETVALTSHLPHLIASVLSLTVLERDQAWLGVGSGFRDSTRIAMGDPLLWQEILLANREALLLAMDSFDAQWRLWRLLLQEAGDLAPYLDRAAKLRKGGHAHER